MVNNIDQALESDVRCPVPKIGKNTKVGTRLKFSQLYDHILIQNKYLLFVHLSIPKIGKN